MEPSMMNFLLYQIAPLKYKLWNTFLEAVRAQKKRKDAASAAPELKTKGGSLLKKIFLKKVTA